jgi:hypothetical protein
MIDHVTNPNMARIRDRPWFNTTFTKLHVFGLEVSSIALSSRLSRFPVIQVEHFLSMREHGVAAPDSSASFNCWLRIWSVFESVGTAAGAPLSGPGLSVRAA